MIANQRGGSTGEITPRGTAAAAPQQQLKVAGVTAPTASTPHSHNAAPAPRYLLGQ